MSDLLRGLAILILLPLAFEFFRLAWTLWRMPYSEQLELQERRQRRLRNRAIVRFLQNGGK